jgi:hypothetical protein
MSRDTRKPSASPVAQFPVGSRPEDLFVERGGEPVDASDPPQTEEERFRERVWQAGAVIRATRFREDEHERLARVLGEMIANEAPVDVLPQERTR